MTEAERIAASLTEAQKRAVSSATWRDGDGAWNPSGWYCYADKRVRRKLCQIGLIGDYLCPSNRLRPLGLEVRRILQGGHDG